LNRFLFLVAIAVVGFSGPPAVRASCIDAHRSTSQDGFESARLTLINGSSIRATISEIDEEGRVLGEGLPDGLDIDQVALIDAGRKVSTSASPKPVVHLPMGGRIACDSLQLDSETVIVNMGGQEQRLPLETIRALVWTDSDRVDAVLQKPSSDSDSVVVATASGDQVVEGILISIDATHVGWEYAGDRRKISLEKVRGIVMAKLDQESDTDGIARVTLIDGSVITGKIAGLKGDMMSISIGPGAVLAFPATRVSTISLQSDRIVYLSDLEPIDVQQSTQFAPLRQWTRDASILGNDIRLKYHSLERVHSYEKGIGTIAYSSLVFKNDRDFNQFRAVAGIDAETRGRGDCEMIVRGDGIQLWAKRIRAAEDPQSIVVDIAGLKEIALVVLPGEGFDLGDHAVWADARFAKIEQ
jgi:hypothetical protein